MSFVRYLRIPRLITHVQSSLKALAWKVRFAHGVLSCFRAENTKARKRKSKAEKRIVEMNDKTECYEFFYLGISLADYLKIKRFNSLDMLDTRVVDCANSYVDCNSCKMKDRCYQNC